MTITKWTKEEVSTLKENMDTALTKLKQLIPIKSEDQIIEKIKLVYRETPNDRWTDDELNIIRGSEGKHTVDLMKLLPNRSFESIRYKRYALGTAESANYGLMAKRPNMNRWSDEDVKSMYDMKAEGYTNYEIAEALNRPLNSVMGRLYTSRNVNANEKKIKDRIVWTPEVTDRVRSMVIAQKTIEEIGTELNINPHKVFAKAIHLGFSSTKIMTDAKKNTGDCRDRVAKIKQATKVKITSINPSTNKLNKKLKN